MSDLSDELRAYDATYNATGAHAMMRRAADAIDALVEALSIVATHSPHLTSGVRAVMDAALLKTEA